MGENNKTQTTITTMRPLWEIIRKHAVPAALAYVTFDSWLASKRASYTERCLEEAKRDGLNAEQAADQVKTKTDAFVNRLQNRAEVTSTNLHETTEEIKRCKAGITRHSSELSSPNLSQERAVEINERIKYYTDMQDKALNKQDEYVKEVKYFTSDDEGIYKSDISDLFVNFVDSCRDYINILSSEQMVILFNLGGYVILAMIITSICLILIGQDLINYYELEFKYPKLAKYINFHVTLRNYYLRFYIVYLYLFILVLISCNIFMFIYDYLPF